jgi:death on curing protein
MEWNWIGVELTLALHDRQLAEHGGPAGVRGMGLLESALARPVNLALYEDPDAAALAASYAFGIARNHAFIDGNKRTAWVLARLFLKANGAEIIFDKADAIRAVMALAAGDLSEEELALWFRERIVAR